MIQETQQTTLLPDFVTIKDWCLNWMFQFQSVDQCDCQPCHVKWFIQVLTKCLLDGKLSIWIGNSHTPPKLQSQIWKSDPGSSNPRRIKKNRSDSDEKSFPAAVFAIVRDLEKTTLWKQASSAG